MPEPALVVDLGSVAVSAALVVDGQSRLMKEPGGSTLRWPSSLCADADGLSVGTAAERRKRAAPAGYVADVRARAVDPTPLVGGDRSLHGPELVSAVLSALRAEAERLHGTAVTRLTLAVPVDWPPGHPGRDGLIAAGDAAGFRDVDLLAEPVAAALDPESGGSAEPAPGVLVLVCDVGVRGAITLVRFTGPSSAEVVAHRVVPGGAELDRVVLDRVSGDDRAWVEPLLAARGDAGLRGRFEVDDFVRRLRHQLSDSEQAEDSPTPLAPPYSLSRATLAGLARPLLDDLVGGCAAVLPDALRSTAQLGCVVFAGGLCRMPALPDVGRHALAPAPINLSRQPELAVVRGAARWAGLLTNRQVAASVPQRRVKPLIWTVPDGPARLLRWTVAAGGRFEAGSVLAIARAGDDTLLDITARSAGTLLERQLASGADISGVLAAVARLDPSVDEYVDLAASIILLGPGRETFIEFDGGSYGANQPKICFHRFDGNLAILREKTLDFGSVGLLGHGVFRGPDGALVLVAKTIGYRFVVVDLTDGTPILTFHDPTEPFTFLIDEEDWTMVTKSRHHGVLIGSKWRNVVWSLVENGRWRRSVQLVAQMTGAAWSRRYDARRFTPPGGSRHSGFAEQATSPDGQLSALITAQHLVVRHVPGGKTVFSAPLPDGAGGGVAFNADGTYLAARTRDGELDRVRVWQL